MAAELFFSVIQKLERRRVEMPELLKKEMKAVINELVAMFDIATDKGLDLNTPLKCSDHPIRDVVEIVEDLLVTAEFKNVLSFLKQINPVRSFLKQEKLFMLEAAVHEDFFFYLHPSIGSVAAAAISRARRVVDTWLDELPDSYEYMSNDMYNLKAELRMIQESLGESGEGTTKRHDYFLSDLVEAVHDVTDLDKYKYSYKFYEEILSIRSRLDLAKTRLLQLVVDRAETIEESSIGGGDEEELVGLEKDVELLLKREVFNEERGLTTSLITGMVGIGKTALARHLYKHMAVVDRFERRAWLHVPGELSNKEVLLRLITQVVDAEGIQGDSALYKILERADNASLQQIIHKHLVGMPYFIVLDDVPKLSRLASIVKALPLEDNGSRLLLTSRSQDIQAAIHYTHVMKTLDSDKSWQLFCKTIFSGTDERKFPKHLERKGREILAKCSGVPLAINEIGNQIAKKRQSGSEWEKVLDSIDFGATLDLLELSYQKLDPQVKSCFLHLAMFKENKAIRAEKLTQIWAAGRVTLEIEAGLFIQKLVSESIIEVYKKSNYGKAKSYRVNGILHRLSIKKAEEEIGLEILRKDGSDQQPSTSARHRVTSTSRGELDRSTEEDRKHLVSLFYRGGGYLDASPSYWKSFELLWILDLEDFGLKVLPESIGALSELTYLGLRNNYLEGLPHSLGDLRKLEVLDISHNFMVEVPDVIWRMSSLLHLYVSDTVCQNPWTVDVSVQNPETLTYISIENWTYDLSGMTRMAELRKLGVVKVDGSSDVSELFVSLARIGYLQRLTLRGFRFRSMPCLDDLRLLHSLIDLKIYGLLAALPTVDNFPPFIYNLKLVNTVVDEDPMPVLEQLPYLKQLELRNAYTGRQMVVTKNGFNTLRVLRVKEQWNLRNLRVGKGGMWRLERLEIKNCPYMETLPEEIGSMTELTELEMVTTRKIAAGIRRSALISNIEQVEITPEM